MIIFCVTKSACLGLDSPRMGGIQTLRSNLETLSPFPVFLLVLYADYGPYSLSCGERCKSYLCLKIIFKFKGAVG